MIMIINNDNEVQDNLNLFNYCNNDINYNYNDDH